MGHFPYLSELSPLIRNVLPAFLFLTPTSILASRLQHTLETSMLPIVKNITSFHNLNYPSIAGKQGDYMYAAHIFSTKDSNSKLYNLEQGEKKSSVVSNAKKSMPGA